MGQLKIALLPIIAVLLQVTLRNVAEPLAYIDFVLIAVVYAALQRNAIRAVLFAFVSGLAVDALSGGLLGANGFSKILVAYIVSEIARRVYLDNLLLRIPIIAGACLLDDFVYYGMHVLFGQFSSAPFLQTALYSLVGTTIVGTITFFLLETFSSNRLKTGRREIFNQRRQTRRRNPIRLGKR